MYVSMQITYGKEVVGCNKQSLDKAPTLTPTQTMLNDYFMLKFFFVTVSLRFEVWLSDSHNYAETNKGQESQTTNKLWRNASRTVLVTAGLPSNTIGFVVIYNNYKITIDEISPKYL